MGIWNTVIKSIVVFGIVIILIIVVFPMIWDVTKETLAFFKTGEQDPLVPDKVSIVGTDPGGVHIHAYDEGFWAGSNDEIDCYPCGNGCCLTVIFDRKMKASDFQGSELKINLKIWEEDTFSDIGVPDVPGDWRQMELSEYSAELKGGNKLTISGIKNDGDLNYRIQFKKGLESIEKIKDEEGGMMPLNPDTAILMFEMS